MALNNRYLPSHPAGASATYALDFSNILPPGVGIASGGLGLEVNTVPPGPTVDFVVGPPVISGRRIYAQLTGGVAARDYRLIWNATDTVGNLWPRTCLLLCAATS